MPPPHSNLFHKRNWVKGKSLKPDEYSVQSRNGNQLDFIGTDTIPLAFLHNGEMSSAVNRIANTWFKNG